MGAEKRSSKRGQGSFLRWATSVYAQAAVQGWGEEVEESAGVMPLSRKAGIGFSIQMGVSGFGWDDLSPSALTRRKANYIGMDAYRCRVVMVDIFIV